MNLNSNTKRRFGRSEGNLKNLWNSKNFAIKIVKKKNIFKISIICNRITNKTMENI